MSPTQTHRTPTARARAQARARERTLRAPDPDLDPAGRGDPVNADAGILPARRRVRAADHFPVAGLVRERGRSVTSVTSRMVSSVPSAPPPPVAARTRASTSPPQLGVRSERVEKAAQFRLAVRRKCVETIPGRCTLPIVCADRLIDGCCPSIVEKAFDLP
jgi:hypothetical protein